MSESPERLTLLDEIEERQNDVLRQLDELNQRVEATLKQFTRRKAGGNEPAAEK